jgi:glycosyltransferase involved in cell wall biosynthesis
MQRNDVTSSSTNGNGDLRSGAPRVAILTNSFTPYRIFLHQRIATEVPEVELWSLATHSNSYRRWTQTPLPPAIRAVEFGKGQPTNEQTQLRFSAREWSKAGRIIRWLEEHQPSAVFCQGCGDVGRLRTLRWCHRQRIPCFLSGDCNIRGDLCRGLKRLVKGAVFRQAVAWAYGTMPCGRYGREIFERYGAAAKPTFFFPFVPDIELFMNPPEDAVAFARRSFGPNLRRRILFSARMAPAKRPDLAIKAFVAIADERPDWDLVMAGDGVRRHELEASVPACLRDRVIWTGFVDDSRQLAGVYANCDVLLLPSDKEPWGVVVVEAAAAGLAIVASDVVGTVPELVHTGRNGAVFPAGNLMELIAALLRVSDCRQIDQLKTESRAAVREWLIEADPVKGFRTALAACGVLASEPSRKSALPMNMHLVDRRQPAARSATQAVTETP